jgi:SAM-dependent methyltransferase
VNNYEYCAAWITEESETVKPTVLDYGCGAGEIVALLRAQNVNAYGCDVYYEAAQYEVRELRSLLDQGIVKRMSDGRIPFGDDQFDYIINNQVMEHVEKLGAVLSEMVRVLKPGGRVLSIFPDNTVWREGHCGIPFLHWFEKESKVRIAYAAALRCAGLGYHKKGKSVWKWSADVCRWLDTWTYYRSRDDIHSEYYKYFSAVEHVEDVWLKRRLGFMKWMVCWWPRSLQRAFANKFAGMVFVATKSKA